MKENRCDKAPVLPGHNEAIVFCPICCKNAGKSVVVLILNVDGIAEHIHEDIMKAVRSNCQCYLVGGETPKRDGADSNDPGDPGDARESMQIAMPGERGLIAERDSLSSR